MAGHRARKSGIFSIGFGILLALVCASVVSAQAFRFGSIAVEGNQRVETATIQSFADLPLGQTVSAAEVNAAIQRIRQTGLFESVDATPRGGTLVITVVERPTVNVVAFEGNRRLSDAELSPIVRTASRRVFDPAQAQRDVENILQAYADQGRLATTVEPQIIRRSENRVDVIFAISESNNVEIERISFVGNNAFSDRRLRRVLATKQAGALRILVRADTFVEDRIEFDRQVLADFYQSRGYVDFRTVSVNSALSQERDGFFLTFNVVEGQQFRFGEVSLTSDLPEVDVDLFERAVLARSGAVYSPIAVESTISRLEALALREDLRFVRVEPRVTRNDRDLTLDIEFAIVRGERVFVERIDIEGNTTTLDRVIRRQFRVVEGDPFNPRAIREAADRIRALGFFSNADVDAREGSSPQEVIIDVDVTEQPTGNLQFGGNFSTESGFGLVASFSQRNFAGRGQSLSLSLSNTESATALNFSFAEPALFERNLRFGLDVNFLSTDNEENRFDTQTFNLRPSIGFPVSPNGRLRLSAFYTGEEITSVSSSPNTIIDDESAEGDRDGFGVGYLYSFDSRRAGINPVTSYVFRFGQDFNGIGGDEQFLTTTVFAGAETMVLNEEVTLRATFRGGALSFFDDAESRVTDRFFSRNSLIRGFERGSVGPREVSNNADGSTDTDFLGGEYYAVVSLEAEFPIGLPEEYGISGGVFFDYGSFWGIERELTPNGAGTNELVSVDFEPRSVVGLSLFWNTPIGPLRFNFSNVLESVDGDEEQNFDLTISTSF